MRSALPSLVLAVCAALLAPNAYAKIPIDAPPRPAAFVEYDRQHGEWLSGLTEQIAADSDPDVALFGAALRARNHDIRIDPPAPATKVGYLLRYVVCDTTRRCPDALAQWVDADPDNIFVLSIAAESDDEAIAANAVKALAQATRYDDYYLEIRRIEQHVLAGYGATPPAKPEGYYSGKCVDTGDDIPTKLLFLWGMAASGSNPATNDALDRAAKLRLARAMVDARHSPIAVLRGAELGVEAALDPIDRADYCRLSARTDAAEDSIGWLLTESRATHSGLQRDFLHALGTRDAVDALDLVASRLPAEHRPDPVDEDAIAECVSDVPDDVDD